MTDERKQSIGALWRKTSRAGGSYYSGEITIGGEVVKLVAYDNDRKTKDTHPDIRIYLSEPRESYQARRDVEDEPNRAALNDLPPTGGSSGIEYPTEDINPDDIPF